jgi:hypothetical protein
MDDEARRLKVLIETNTLVLEELARLDDPALTNLIRELERARAEAEIQLGQRRAEQEERQPPPPNDTPAGGLSEDPDTSRPKPSGRATTPNTHP